MGWISRQIKRAAEYVRKSFSAGMFYAGTLWDTAGSIARTKACYDAYYWARKYDECSYLQAPIRRICEDFASVNWCLKRKFIGPTGRRQFVEVIDHPILDILERPNPKMTGFEFFETAQRYLETAGRVLIDIEFDDRGIPVNLWLVASHYLQDIPRKNQPLFKFRNQEGILIEREPWQVMFFTYRSLQDPYGFGVGRTTALTRPVELSENADDWSLNLFKNGSHVGAIVDIPDIPDEDQKAIQAHFNKNHTGLENAHKTLFVSSSSTPGQSGNKSMNVAKLGSNHRELDYTAGKKLLKDDVREHFFVPPELVGDSKNSNRATVSAAENLQAIGNTRPKCKLWKSWLNVYFVPLFKDRSLCLDFENPVKEEAEFRHKSLLEGSKNGLCRPNEWREDRGLDPWPGAIGESTYLPLNMQVVDPESATPPAATPLPEKQAADQAQSAIDQAAKTLKLLEALCRTGS